MKYIVIVKCSNPNSWYASKIGSIMKIEESVDFEKEYTIKLDNKKKQISLWLYFKRRCSDSKSFFLAKGKNVFWNKLIK